MLHGEVDALDSHERGVESASDVVDYGMVEQPEPSTLWRVPQSQYIDRSRHPQMRGVW